MKKVDAHNALVDQAEALKAKLSQANVAMCLQSIDMVTPDDLMAARDKPTAFNSRR